MNRKIKNRKIKYRGKRLDNGEWVYGDLLNIAGGRVIYYGSHTDCALIEDRPNLAVELYMDEVSPVDPETVAQLTGIHDKNRKEVYEEDILRVCDGKRCFNIVVKWSKEAMAFMACYCDGNQSPLSWFSGLLSGTHETEVIGNIHDNPELLKGGER